MDNIQYDNRHDNGTG